MNPVPAAVFNPVANTIGLRVFTSPLTSEKILKAMKSEL
jgi:CO/xanthine dehydrogenase Mo-binding subunit